MKYVFEIYILFEMGINYNKSNRIWNILYNTPPPPPPPFFKFSNPFAPPLSATPNFKSWIRPCPPYTPLNRNAKLRVVHLFAGRGMPGTFSLPSTSKKASSWRSRHASRHVRHAHAVIHVGIANPRWRGKRFRHSKRTRTQFCVSGKRPMMMTS